MKRFHTAIVLLAAVYGLTGGMEVRGETIDFDFTNNTSQNIVYNKEDCYITAEAGGTVYTLKLTHSDGRLLMPDKNTWGGNCAQFGNNSSYALGTDFNLEITPALPDVAQIKITASQTKAGASCYFTAGVRDSDGRVRTFKCNGSGRASLSTTANQMNDYTFTTKQSVDGLVTFSGSIEGGMGIRYLSILYNHEIEPNLNYIDIDLSNDNEEGITVDAENGQVTVDCYGTDVTLVCDNGAGEVVETGIGVDGGLQLGSQEVPVAGKYSIVIANELTDIQGVDLTVSGSGATLSVAVDDGSGRHVLTCAGRDIIACSAGESNLNFTLNHSAGGNVVLSGEAEELLNVKYIGIHHGTRVEQPSEIVLDYATMTSIDDNIFMTDAGGQTYGMMELGKESPFTWWCDIEGYEGIQFGSNALPIGEFVLKLNNSFEAVDALKITLLAVNEAAFRVYAVDGSGNEPVKFTCRGSEIVNINNYYCEYTLMPQSKTGGQLYLSGIGQNFIRVGRVAVYSGDVSGIEDVIVDENVTDDRAYDLTGRPVSPETYRGVMIQGGRKVVRL